MNRLTFEFLNIPGEFHLQESECCQFQIAGF